MLGGLLTPSSSATAWLYATYASGKKSGTLVQDELRCGNQLARNLQVDAVFARVVAARRGSLNSTSFAQVNGLAGGQPLDCPLEHLRRYVAGSLHVVDDKIDNQQLVLLRGRRELGAQLDLIPKRDLLGGTPEPDIRD